MAKKPLSPSQAISATGKSYIAMIDRKALSLARHAWKVAKDHLKPAKMTHTNIRAIQGIAQDVVAAGEIILRIDPACRQIKTAVHAVEDLAAGGDIAARAIHSFDSDGWIVSARVVNQATAAAGIDDSNTCVITLATGAGTVVTETFDSTTTFPAANTAQNLGAVDNNHVGAGSVLTLAVTNGTTADPGPFLVAVDYV